MNTQVYCKLAYRKNFRIGLHCLLRGRALPPPKVAESVAGSQSREETARLFPRSKMESYLGRVDRK